MDQINGFVGSTLERAFRLLIPGSENSLGSQIENGLGGSPGDLLTYYAVGLACSFLQPLAPAVFNRLWVETGVTTSGKPVRPGFGCGNLEEFARKQPKNSYQNETVAFPDFIFKEGEPSATDGKPKGWLVGDVKQNLQRLKSDYVDNDKGQWKAIANFAKYQNGHQYIPMTFFIVGEQGPDAQSLVAALQVEALRENVFMYAISIRD